MLQNTNKIYFNQAEPTSNTKKKQNRLIIDCFLLWTMVQSMMVTVKMSGLRSLTSLGEWSLKTKVGLEK